MFCDVSVRALPYVSLRSVLILICAARSSAYSDHVHTDCRTVFDDAECGGTDQQNTPLVQFAKKASDVVQTRVQNTRLKHVLHTQQVQKEYKGIVSRHRVQAGFFMCHSCTEPTLEIMDNSIL